MLKVLIILGGIYFIYRHFKSKMLDGMGMDSGSEPQRGAADDVMVQDPECGVYFPLREGVSARINGKTVNFCSTECRDAFLKKQG
ncbi:MAG: hypothetical protein MI742_07545 [Desulfobacterales bacterium]|nr:hypothetical protein [Desulfobacterales bacterium]